MFLDYLVQGEDGRNQAAGQLNHLCSLLKHLNTACLNYLTSKCMPNHYNMADSEVVIVQKIVL